MTDKQIIINGVDVAECKYFDRFRSICHNKNLCCDCEKNQDCYYKQLKRKEQECEICKNQVLTLDDETITVQITQQQFVEYNQLKADNNLFRTCHDNEQEKRRKYEQILTEIKEIAEEVYNDCDNCYRDVDTNSDIDCIDCTLGGKAKLAKQILQEISECEV